MNRVLVVVWVLLLVLTIAIGITNFSNHEDPEDRVVVKDGHYYLKPIEKATPGQIANVLAAIEENKLRQDKY